MACNSKKTITRNALKWKRLLKVERSVFLLVWIVYFICVVISWRLANGVGFNVYCYLVCIAGCVVLCAQLRFNWKLLIFNSYSIWIIQTLNERTREIKYAKQSPDKTKKRTTWGDCTSQIAPQSPQLVVMAAFMSHSGSESRGNVHLVITDCYKSRMGKIHRLLRWTPTN